MKKLLFLLALAALVQGVFAEEGDYEPLFTIGFEESEGYVLGDIADQQGWCRLNDRGTNEVIDADCYSGERSLHLFGTEFKAHKDFDLDNYQNLPTRLTFAFKPSGSFTRISLYGSGVNDTIATMHIKCEEVATDTSGYCSKTGLSFDTLEWYECALYLDPATKTISSFTMGEEVDFEYNENQDRYRNYESAESGKIGGILLYSNWNDASDSYIDDICISVVPEPACLFFTALIGLCLIRKQR